MADEALRKVLSQVDDALEAGDVAKAEKTLIPLEKSNPREAHVMVARARVQASRGDFGGAIKLLEEVVGKNPMQPIPMAYLGQVLTAQGQWALARPRLEKALQLGLDKPSLRHALGVAHFRLGRAADAVTHLQKAADAAPGKPEILVQLAAALDAAGKADQATQVVSQLKDLAPTDPNAYVLLANFQRDHGKPNDALATLDEALARFKDQHALRRAKAAILGAMGRTADIATTLRAIPDAERNAEDWAFLSTMALAEKKPQDALKAAQAAVAADPGWWRSHQALGLAKEEATPADGDGVVAAYTEAIRLGDPEGLAGTRLGLLLLSVNAEANAKEAVNVLEATRTRAGDQPATLWHLAMAYARLKDTAKAKTLCQTLGSQAGAPAELKEQAKALLAELPKLGK